MDHWHCLDFINNTREVKVLKHSPSVCFYCGPLQLQHALLAHIHTLHTNTQVWHKPLPGITPHMLAWFYENLATGSAVGGVLST